MARVRRIHERAGLPVKGAALGADRYLELMAHDKKVSDGTLRLVLLKAIGKAVITRRGQHRRDPRHHRGALLSRARR